METKAITTIQLNSLSIADKQNLLQHAIAPRPIALASTISLAGEVNLSPFSFFNLFSTNPPIVIISPSRRARDGTTKHTLHNVLEVPQVVINIVDYDMVHQMSLSSCEYPQGVNEFVKAGFTPIPSVHILPPRVQESKVQLECKVIEIKSLGNKAGAGQLIIAEVLTMHIHNSILSKEVSNVPNIDQTLLHHVARLGGNWYTKVDAANLFTIPKPNTQLGIGVDALPHSIKHSNILTGNNLGQLANVSSLPTIDPNYNDEVLKNIFQYYGIDTVALEKELHIHAANLLAHNNVHAAWQVLLSLE